MSIHWLLFMLLFLVSCSQSGQNGQGSIENSIEENRVLASELKLAQKPSVYFLFDLTHKQIYAKHRGRVLKALSIDAVYRWGQPAEIRPHVLVKKSTFFKPKRKAINPGASDATTAENLDALELDDMPANYSLLLDDGTTLTVRQRPEGIVSGIVSSANMLVWYITRPLCSIRKYLQKKACLSYYVTMDPQGAHALYWMYYESLPSVIRPSHG